MPSLAHDYVYGNYYLSSDERAYNAQFIYYWCKMRWQELSFNSCMALLGNFEQESTINPGLWQGFRVGWKAFGVAQWDPASKLFNWLRPQGLPDYDLVGQLRWIKEYTTVYGQWRQHSAPYNITFNQWVTSDSEDLDFLTRCYCINWEQAGNAQMENRLNYARHWYSVFSGEDYEPLPWNPDWPVGPSPTDPDYPYGKPYFNSLPFIYWLKPYNNYM